MVAIGGKSLRPRTPAILTRADAWLEGPDGRGGTTRTPTAHAFNVFVRSGFTKHCNPVDCIKIGEPTYSCTSFDDKGPGSGHIIKVSWLLYPNPGSTKHSGKTVSGSAIAVDAAHNMVRPRHSFAQAPL